jgi:hypothetical protein
MPYGHMETLIVNNLFQYSAKELATDAFLAWLFVSFNTESKLRGKAAGFFSSIGLSVILSDKTKIDIKSTDIIDTISAAKQDGDTDLIIT